MDFLLVASSIYQVCDLLSDVLCYTSIHHKFIIKIMMNNRVMYVVLDLYLMVALHFKLHLMHHFHLYKHSETKTSEVESSAAKTL